MSRPTRKNAATDSEAKSSFKWTDDEVELLLRVTLDYKASKAGEGTDWESVQSKYSDILNRMLEEYLDTPEAASELSKDYPHKKEEITKQEVTTKLKAIRVNFRQAVDTGRKSGCGRVVYELCESIWAGFPATEQLSSGLETTDTEKGHLQPTSTDNTSTTSSLNSR